jgi:rubrerythrin
MAIATLADEALIDAAPACFALQPRAPAVHCADVPTPRLDDRTAQALADVLPLLGCGEEAAAIAFRRLADRTAQDSAQRASAVVLHTIEAEERAHDALLKRLCARLPQPADSTALRIAARRFHLQLSARDLTLHLARIAAIDSAVCTILSRLTSSRAAIAQDPALVRLFHRIRRDEARHVAVTRAIVGERGGGEPLRRAGAAARQALAALLGLRGATFDRLRVDPDALMRDVARLPRGLL